MIHVILSKPVLLRFDRRVTKVGRVGLMVKGKTPPAGEDKHLFQKKGLKCWLLLTVVCTNCGTNLSKLDFSLIIFNLIAPELPRIFYYTQSSLEILAERRVVYST